MPVLGLARDRTSATKVLISNIYSVATADHVHRARARVRHFRNLAEHPLLRVLPADQVLLLLPEDFPDFPEEASVGVLVPLHDDVVVALGLDEAPHPLDEVHGEEVVLLRVVQIAEIRAIRAQ